MPLAAMLAALASTAASLCGVLRALFGDFFSLLSGMKISEPFSGMVSTCLADMVDLLLLSWVQAHCAPAPLPVGETRGSKCQGDPGGGGSPARKGRLVKRV